MGIQKTLINMGLLGLFVFGMMSFIIVTQNDSSVNNSLVTNDLINESFEDLQSELGSAKSQATATTDTFGEVPPDTQAGEIKLSSIFAVGRTIKAITIGLWNVFIKLPQAVLGVSPIIANFITALLIIFVVIGLWAIIKGGISA